VQLLRGNQDLRTKYHEIPQAEADILTAGLRSNPIIFWDAGGTPYGRFSNQPGARSYPLLITYRLDFTGRRAARVRLAQTVKRVLDARYQDEVRRKIDELDAIFIDVLEARQAVREARRSAAEASDPARRGHRASPGRKPVVERTLSAMALRNAEDRLRVVKHDLAALLDIPAAEADGIELYGALRVPTPAPPIEVLLHIALNCRADLVAQRLSVDRAHALERMEYSRRIRDTHILYQPWDYVVGQTNQGERSANTWGIALFAPLPLFDRNQGNIQRARLEISKMQSAFAEVERRVADDVRAAFGEFDTTLKDQQELEDQVLPVVRQEMDEATRAGDDAAQAARKDYDEAMRAYREIVVRHRRSITRLNTAVGQRVVPCSPPEQELSGGPKPMTIRQAVQAKEPQSR
jgi:cobalt-zinc-cadmium efflux system outer membrane protein